MSEGLRKGAKTKGGCSKFVALNCAQLSSFLSLSIPLNEALISYQQKGKEENNGWELVRRGGRHNHLMPV